MTASQLLNHSNPKPKHIPELDGLRGLLASWVVISHMFGWAGARELAWRFPEFAKPAWWGFMDAQIPVQVFMILSGFAISFLADKYRDSYPAFMVNRIFRIYPIYLLCLALGIATQGIAAAVLEQVSWANTNYFPGLRDILSSEQKHPATHFFLHLTLLNGLLPREALWNSTATFLPPAWSIALEWQFYLVAPLLLSTVRTPKGLAIALGVAWCGTLIAPSFSNPRLAFLPSQLPLFLIGMASFFLYRSPAVNGRLVTFIALGGIGISGALQWNWAAVGIWSLVLAAILLPNAAQPHKVLIAGRWLLMQPITQYLGKVSYPLYLVHWPLIVVALYVFNRVWPSGSYLSALAWLLTVGLIGVVGVAHLLHKTVEKPGLNLGRRVTSWLTGPGSIKAA